MTDRYAVVGHPVAHSKSPAIHRLFAEQTGQDMVYETLLAPLDGFAETTRKFFAEGGKGLNVTVPFKAEAFVLADTCSSRAVQAGAVNTLGMDADGRLWGDNTDGVGLVRDLRGALGLTLSEHRLLVLGAGVRPAASWGPCWRKVRANWWSPTGPLPRRRRWRRGFVAWARYAGVAWPTCSASERSTSS